MHRIAALVFLFVVKGVFAQAVLPYEINSHLLPADTSKIHRDILEGGIKSGNFQSEQFKAGDIVPDFTLFDIGGKSVQLSKLLGEGKPVLLIAMSYTCPRSRESATDGLRFINRSYGKRINIRVVYTMEAHPMAPDACPFTGEVINNPENITDSVYFPQARSYGERKYMASEFVKRFQIPVPVLIDGPGNEYWKTFGPSPNHAYLITPGGMIYRKYAWFKDAKDRAKFDIPLLLSDSVLMRTNFSKEAWIGIGKKAGSLYLFVPNTKYFEITIVDKSGNKVFHKDKIDEGEFELEKTNLPMGTYGILVKTANTRSYCLHYEKD